MNDTEISLRVKEIITETSDTKTFVLEPLVENPLKYQAGQFLTLIFDFQGRELRRSYSLSSAPSHDVLPAITVKRQSNGEVSRYMMGSIKVGDLLKSLRPSGLFFLDESKNEKVESIILIGAGSGITPLFSILKQVLNTNDEIKVVLIYSNRNSKQTIFKDALETLEKKYSQRLKIISLQSQPHHDWNGMVGRLNNTRLQNIIQRELGESIQKSKVFISGPYSFMRTVDITLKFIGFESDQIRKENFVISPKTPKSFLSSDQKIELFLTGKKYELLVPENVSILDAALSNTINLPYSCKGGQCATCLAKCVSGSVNMVYNEVLSDNDLKAGLILTCCSFVNQENVKISIG